MLSFESEIFSGAQSIAEKLASLKVASKVTGYDIQPSNGGILIYLSGLLQIEGESNPMNFIRCFFLHNNNGNYYSKFFSLNI
jgi:hypothetical protein